MATKSVNTVRTANEHPQTRTGLLLGTYVVALVGTIAIATGTAVLLAGLTNGLGQFVLLAGGWLAVVSASPTLAGRATTRIADSTFSQRTAHTNRSVRAVVTAIFAR